MAGIIENEMTGCLQQMAELQVKMEHLQEEKNNKAVEELVKQSEVEPNLKIMSDWLNEYGKILDEVERERIIEEQYKRVSERGHPAEVYKNKDIITEQYSNLYKKKRSRLHRHYYGNGERVIVVGEKKNLSRKEILNKAPNFINQHAHSPTYFMKQYIESTHNMFLIQQKKIDELEKKIKKIECNKYK